MSIREAKLELKARGLKDPARNSLYKNVVKETIPLKIGNISNSPNKNLVDEPPSKNTANNKVPSAYETKGRTIESTNPYSILNEIEQEICEDESIDDSQESKSNKRNRDILSPPKNTNIMPRSVKPKIQRVHEIPINETDESLELMPSPVFESKFKIVPNKKSSFSVKDNQSTIIESDSKTREKEPHEHDCGCHICFVDMCLKEEKLSKDILRNLIQNFIANRKMGKNNENLESHGLECLCLDHLKYYRTNKIKILDKILNKQLKEILK